MTRCRRPRRRPRHPPDRSSERLSFLERQESARLRTRLYTLQFGLLSVPCIAATFVATMCSVWLIFAGLTAHLLEITIGERDMDRVISNPAFILVSGVLCTILVLWVLVWKKRRQLARSGEYVSKELGAMQVSRVINGAGPRRLHNICEEMALAAGIPPPDVYLWPQDSIINALTVGHSPSDAAIFVTRGAVDSLSRDELQALVGYTMSQVLNGDMALNSRLATYLYAFKFAPRVARWWLLFPFDQKGFEFVKALFAWVFFIMWIGIALTLVTWPGYLGARLMQTLIGRECQKLADASAVQFTRNPAALESTLVKALAMGTAIPVVLPALDDLAHGCFAEPIERRVLGIHRPLPVRIRTLNPQLDDAALEELKQRTSTALAQRRAEALDERRSAVNRAEHRYRRASMVERVSAAAAVLATAAPSRRSAPLAHMTASGDPRAVLLALLLERKPEVQRLQLEVVRRNFGEADMLAMAQSLRALRPLSPRERTLALDTHLPALRALPPAELQRLSQTIAELEATDDSTDVFEYAIARRVLVFIRDLLEPRDPHGKHELADRAVALGTVLSVVAQHGGKPELALGAFAAGARELGLSRPLNFVPSAQWVRPLDRALAALESLQPTAKDRFIQAMAAAIRCDQAETAAESELVRTIAASLHCPVPRAMS
jgi:Zn-dependent protease with chaperone function